MCPSIHNRSAEPRRYFLLNSLDWQIHVGHVTRKVFGTVYTRRFFRHALLREIRKHVVETLAFPLLDYASLIYNHLDKERIKKIEKALKA